MPRARVSIAERMRLDRLDPTLDRSRAEGPDPRDPRAQGPPCSGAHSFEGKNARVANAHMVQYKCLRCTVRVLYVPKFGSTGNYRKASPLQAKNDPAGPHNPEGNKKNTDIPEAEEPPTEEPEAPKSKGKTAGKTANKAEKAEKAGATSKAKPKKETKPKEEPQADPEHFDIGDPLAPPTWDPQEELWKDYQKRLKEWYKAVAISSSEAEEAEEEEEEEKEAPSREEDSTASAAPASVSEEWEKLTKKLEMEVDQRGKRVQPASITGSRASPAATPVRRKAERK